MRAALLIIAATLFLTSVAVEQCEAQILSRFRNQLGPAVVAPPLLYQPAGHVGAYILQNPAAKPVFPVAAYSPKQSRISRILDGPMTYKDRNPAEVDARYIGGFHQTHFQNVGIPSGDIGIRGNAYRWRTW